MAGFDIGRVEFTKSCDACYNLIGRSNEMKRVLAMHCSIIEKILGRKLTQEEVDELMFSATAVCGTMLICDKRDHAVSSDNG